MAEEGNPLRTHIFSLVNLNATGTKLDADQKTQVVNGVVNRLATAGNSRFDEALLATDKASLDKGLNAETVAAIKGCISTAVENVSKGRDAFADTRPAEGSGQSHSPSRLASQVSNSPANSTNRTAETKR